MVSDDFKKCVLSAGYRNYSSRNIRVSTLSLVQKPTQQEQLTEAQWTASYGKALQTRWDSRIAWLQNRLDKTIGCTGDCLAARLLKKQNSATYTQVGSDTKLRVDLEYVPSDQSPLHTRGRNDLEKDCVEDYVDAPKVHYAADYNEQELVSAIVAMEPMEELTGADAEG